MKLLILGLDGASPDILTQDERLGNLRRLMDLGLYGLIEGFPTESAWSQLFTSQSSASDQTSAVWNHLEDLGKKSILVGAPPDCVPQSGIAVSPGLIRPLELKSKIFERVGDYPISIDLTRPKEELQEQIFETSRKQWEITRWLMTDQQ